MRFPPAVLLLLPLCACGAGILAGAAASKNGNKPPPPEVRPPALSVPEPTGPLVPPLDVTPVRAVFVSNLAIDPGAKLEVELRALGIASRQTSPILLSSGNGSSVIGFLLNTGEFIAKVADPTAQDIEAQLGVRVGGSEIAPPVPFLLFRQPKAMLVPPPGQQQQVLSVRGGTRLTIRVQGLVAKTVDDLQIQIAVRDPNNGALFVRQSCTNLLLETTGADVRVSGNAPSCTYPTNALVAVIDAKAGSSTLVSGVYYKPEIELASPRIVPTDGGPQITLTGLGFAPFDFANQSKPVLDFARVAVFMRKGGRETRVAPESMRPDLSSLNRLVFTSPPSPDGRAGACELAVRVDLGAGVLVEAAAQGILSHGYETVVFGPRGIALAESPIRVAFGRLEGRSDPATDVALLSSSGGLPRVHLLASRQNGLFTRFGPAIDGGVAADPLQRNPAALSIGDTDRDGRNDVTLVNAGVSGQARFTTLLGKDKPAPPLALHGGVALTAGGSGACRSGDFDEDGLEDLLVLQGAGAANQDPVLFLANPTGVGAPAFRSVAVPFAAPGPYDAVDVQDLDGDAHQDLVLARGGAVPRLVIGYGDGRGAFVNGPVLDVTIPGYAAQPSVPAVGVHGCGPGPRRALVLVMAGLPASSTTRPCVAVLAPGQTTRTYEQPVAAGVLAFDGAEQPLACSTASDLDGDALVELLLGHAGSTKIPLRLLRWNAGRFSDATAGVGVPVEAPHDLAQIGTGLTGSGARAVFVRHKTTVDGVPEDWIATFLVTDGQSLAAPDAAREVPLALEGVSLGDFTQHGGTTQILDVAVAGPGELRVLRNDGLGEFAPRSTVAAPGIVPRTLASARVAGPAPGQALVALTSDGRLAVLPPGAPGLLFGTDDLRRLGPPAIHARPVAATSQLRAGDVDGDGIVDLAVLLVTTTVAEPLEGEALVMLLRGKSTFAPSEVPWHMPAAGLGVATAHGHASGMALGDFVRGPGASNFVEAVVAIPRADAGNPGAGNQLRFYRYEAGSQPAEDRFVRSFASDTHKSLIAGEQPTLVVAADFDSNGTVDLAVAAAGDGRLRIHLNSGAVVPGKAIEVNLGAFQESFATPPPLPPGRPVELLVGECNGDQAVDLLAATRLDAPTPDTTTAFYLGNGAGGLRLGGLLPNLRTGNTVSGPGGVTLRGAAASMALGDLNADGSPDLVIGWATKGSGDRNLRALFTGSR